MTPLRGFLLSRVALWAVALVALVAVEPNPARGPWDTARLHDLGGWVDVWARWDANWFLRIAEEGYDWPSVTPAFFPLYPGLVAGLGRLLGGHFVLAGVALSWAATAVAGLLLLRLAGRLAGPRVARRSLVALAVFPTSFFLTAVYSESLFLALALGSFLLAEQGRFGRAGLVAGLAMLTRAQGVALLPALLLLAWQRRRGRGPVLSVLSAVPVAALYPVLLGAWLGRPFAFLDAEDVWERHLSPLGPLGGLWQSLADDPRGWRWALELGTAAVVLPLVPLAWRRLGAAYGLYAALAVALPLSVPSERLGGLYSFPRLCLAAFPVLIAAGTLRLPRPVAAVALAASGAAAVACVVLWASWTFVA